HSQTYPSAVWRCNANGSGLRRLATLDAFGLGPLQLTPDGRALVFARVDNSWALWRHRLAGDRVTPALVARYGPRVAVVRLGLNGAVATLVADAHLPAVQPLVARRCAVGGADGCTARLHADTVTRATDAWRIT